MALEKNRAIRNLRVKLGAYAEAKCGLSAHLCDISP